ncbi:hypothetical protein EDB82DRAFT_269447 [Fusarium venenatum]|uniref:uncharacterized protein n=1 Tax=Fusarium venenatum TaxID=56646 RepID=UPI001E1050B9|nr:hypothetical protein EDB82DRAFT_269447 [Fusarium venenatum]
MSGWMKCQLLTTPLSPRLVAIWLWLTVSPRPMQVPVWQQRCLNSIQCYHRINPPLVTGTNVLRTRNYRLFCFTALS